MMSELDEKILGALEKDYPWVKDAPLTNELIRIHHEEFESGAPMGEQAIKAALRCVKAATDSILPHVEITDKTRAYVVVALRAIADSVEGLMTDLERDVVRVMCQMFKPEAAFVRATKKNDLFGEEKK